MSLNSIGAITGLASRAPEKPVGSNEQIGSKLESMFASVLIKTMRQTIDGDGLFPGDSSDVLGGLFDQYMGDHLAQGNGLGLAKFFDANMGVDSSDNSNDGASVDATEGRLHGK